MSQKDDDYIYLKLLVSHGYNTKIKLSFAVEYLNETRNRKIVSILRRKPNFLKYNLKIFFS